MQNVPLDVPSNHLNPFSEKLDVSTSLTAAELLLPCTLGHDIAKPADVKGEHQKRGQSG